MKIGIKCEIHSCTVEVMRVLLSDYFSEDDCHLLTDSLSARIDVQYYVDRVVDKNSQDIMIKQAPVFHVKCLEILVKLTQKDILRIRSLI